MGLFWSKGYNSDPALVTQKIEYGRSIGLKGFVIFQLAEWDRDANNGEGAFIDDSPLLNLLTVDSAANNYQAPFKEPIDSCLAVH